MVLGLFLTRIWDFGKFPKTLDITPLYVWYLGLHHNFWTWDTLLTPYGTWTWTRAWQSLLIGVYLQITNNITWFYNFLFYRRYPSLDIMHVIINFPQFSAQVLHSFSKSYRRRTIKMTSVTWWPIDLEFRVSCRVLIIFLVNHANDNKTVLQRAERESSYRLETDL